MPPAPANRPVPPLGSVSRRLFFLAIPLGSVILTVSLVSFFSSPYFKIFEVEHYYGWSKGDGALTVDGQFQAGKTDVLYTLDRNCALPLADAVVQRRQAELEAHKAIKPPVDYANFAPSTAWEQKDVELSVALAMAQDAAKDIGSQAVRAMEVRDEIARPTLIPLSQEVPRAPQALPSSKNQFETRLRGDLHIFGLSPVSENAIYENCLRKEPVEYKLISTSWKSDLRPWWRYSGIYPRLGLVLIVVGFFGSFGQSFALGIWNLTGAQVIKWVRNQ